MVAKDYLAGRKYICCLASHWLRTHHSIFMDQSGFILARSHSSAFLVFVASRVSFSVLVNSKRNYIKEFKQTKRNLKKLFKPEFRPW